MKILNDFITWWNREVEYTEEELRDRYIVDNRYYFPKEAEFFIDEFNYPDHTIYLCKDNTKIKICNIDGISVEWYMDNNDIKNDIKYIIEKEIIRRKKFEDEIKQRDLEIINNYKPINKE